MLFSEPKIPQYHRRAADNQARRVSVLFSEPKIPQSVGWTLAKTRCILFQCSSASRKFLNTDQRHPATSGSPFQCSSASRKFLNVHAVPVGESQRERFSALQRAENSSIMSALCARSRSCSFSALQRAENSSIYICCRSFFGFIRSFSALQRAENSSIAPHR